MCALAGVVVLHAQDAPAALDPVDTTVGPTQSVYTPLTLGQKYLFTARKTFGGGGLALVSMKAAFDQTLDRPHQWGTGADSFAVRTASYFGRSFLRQNIAFGVRALDGEDPRYFVSGTGTKWERAKYAIGHTFAVRNDAGNWMPAYSLLVSDFATPFIVNEWRPDRHSVPREFRTGAAGLGIAIGSSLWQEFWPDLRRKFHRDLPFSIGDRARHP